ncbi:MAG: hypothetical protein WDO72_05395 [Pseudomonadota bacterium]
MKVVAWWVLLSAVAAINIVLWCLAAGADDRDPASAQLVLSGLYVFGCAFRSFLPIYDIPRLCLVNTWASTVIVGRSVATVAELAFAAQWAVYLHASELESLRVVSLLIVPLITIAQICCWHAVLTTRNLGHVFENSLWGVSAALIVVGLLATAYQWPASRTPLLATWVVGGAMYIAYIFIVDVPMYWSRWKSDEAQGRKYLSLTQGVADASRRSQTSFRWEVWRSEVVWMTLYFSVGVWVSLSLIFATPSN